MLLLDRGAPHVLRLTGGALYRIRCTMPWPLQNKTPNKIWQLWLGLDSLFDKRLRSTLTSARRLPTFIFSCKSQPALFFATVVPRFLVLVSCTVAQQKNGFVKARKIGTPSPPDLQIDQCPEIAPGATN